MTRFVGVDYGLERTGLAIGEDETGMAFPLTTLALKNFANRKSLLDALAAAVCEARADAVVVGLPLDENGDETERCAVVRNFVKRLKRRLDLPIYFISEYLSSADALEELITSGAKPRKRKAILDQVAAKKILQSFLDQPAGRRISA